MSPGWFDVINYTVLGFVKKFLLIIAFQMNMSLSNDGVGLPQLALPLLFFITNHADDNLNVLLGLEDLIGFVLLYWPALWLVSSSSTE